MDEWEENIVCYKHLYDIMKTAKTWKYKREEVLCQ